jgi:hypothetical protein
MARRFQIAALFLMILLLLGYGFQKAELAGVYSDPISGFRAQDETTYAAGAVGMVTGAGWITPKVVGRFYLMKPPLLIWLSGLSMRVLGISRFAFRLPVLIVGALAALLLFLWSERRYSRWTAAAVVLLAMANPLWHMLSRLGYIDMLLVLGMIGALWAFDRDWTLSQPWNIFLFGACVAFGVMAKNVAGLLPLPVVLLAYLLARRRPPLVNLLKACAVTCLLLAPWHLYQFVTHPRWFWADYVQTQLLEFGLDPPMQPSADGPVWFYLKRLLLTDPLLLILSAAALPSLLGAVRDRKQEAALLLSWLLVTGGALLTFHYRDLRYLLYAIPPLCLMAAVYAVKLGRPKLVAAALAAVFCIKAAAGSQVWGLAFSAAPVPPAKWLRWYAAQRRFNELIAVNSDDEFYATALQLPKIRYCYLDPSQLGRRFAPHYAFLGITVSAAQFGDLDHWEPLFRERLRSWGLDSAAPVATAILAGSMDEIVRLVVTHPAADFYLPANVVVQLPEEVIAARRMVLFSRDRSFLLAADLPRGRASPLVWRMSESW